MHQKGSAMRNKTRLLLLTLLLLAFAPLLMADAGPKPAMDFELEYEISPAPEIRAVTLLECQQEDCSDGTALEELGSQGIHCPSSTDCHSMAYGYDGKYFQLVLEFSDGVTRTSNVFTKHRFNASYKVSVTEDTLEVKKAGGSGNPMLYLLLLMLALICGGVAIVIVGVVLIVRAIRRRKAKKQAEEQGEAEHAEGEEAEDPTQD